jgi:tetratricopeptide (TPR) repeat protein
MADQDLWKVACVTRLDEAFAAWRIRALTSSWPFQSTERRIPFPAPHTPFDRIVQQMASGSFTWEQAHVAAAEYARTIGDSSAMVTEYQTLIAMLPQNVSAYLILGEYYLMKGERTRARDFFERSLLVENTFVAQKSLAAILIDSGKPDSALIIAQKATGLALTPNERSQADFLGAVALLRSGHREQAEEQLRRVLDRNPQFLPARRLLEQILGRQ